MKAPAEVSWPRSQAGELLGCMAEQVGLALSPVESSRPPDTGEAFARWLDTTAATMGLEVVRVSTRYSDAREALLHSGPALLTLSNGSLIGLLGPAGARRVRVLPPDLRPRRISVEDLRADLCASLEEHANAHVDAVLSGAGVAGRRRERAREALLDQLLGERALDACWVLRVGPHRTFSAHARRAGLASPFARLVIGHMASTALLLVSWWSIGRGALSGHLDPGWLLGWALVLLTTLPFRVLVTAASGRVAVRWGALLKDRLLVGALGLDPEAVRHEGAGALLGRVVESEAVEALALNGGFAAIMALVDLGAALWILSHGAAATPLTFALAAWIAATGFWAWRLLRARVAWTDQRRALTHELVERMAGHRTRLAQQAPSRWHDGEDPMLASYLGRSGELDAAQARLLALVPRGWAVLALGLLMGSFAFGDTSTAERAVALGGILLSMQALTGMVGGLAALGGVAAAWREIAPLFRSAEQSPTPGSPAMVAGLAPEARSTQLLEARGLRFAYPGRTRPVLDDVTLTVHTGDRILLEGTSGGGKSTLAAMLVGLREPDSGLLLLRGLDRRTIGDHGWRSCAVAAPQFHENHVVMSTFAFNLLMGRRWPPTQADLADAEAVCMELGLGPLLERMPAGLQQVVGESGWQLSHGERSRMYLARALLQDAELVVLDESFAALDPANLSRALACVFERARTVVVIAHP